MEITEIRNYSFKSESCFSMLVENNGKVEEIFINAQSYLSIHSMLTAEQALKNERYGEILVTKIK